MLLKTMSEGVEGRPNVRFGSARGMAALLLAMGIGRFAFTPLLPPMQADAQFSDAAAGFLASINLLGYLAGALLAERIPHSARGATYRIGLVIAVLADILTAAPLSLPGWAFVRCVAGISSGLIFVFATAFVIEARGNAPLHFAGVGLGIVVSGVVAALVPVWQAAWWVLAGLAALLAVPAMGLRPTARPSQPAERRRLTWSRPYAWLTIAYTLEGFGYIVSGTFLVAILHALPETAALGPLTWIFVGIGAIFSPLLWLRVAMRFGSWQALAIAYAVQACSIMLPFAGGAAAALAAGICFGATFTGITGVSLRLGAHLRPAEASQALARLTACYSIGQAIGPFFAGVAAEAAKGFVLPLLAAAVAVAIAGALSIVGQRSEAHEMQS